MPELYEAIVKQFGGHEKFAEEVFQVYLLARQKGQTSTAVRLLEAVMYGIKDMSDRGMLGGDNVIEGMDDDELDRALRAEVESVFDDMADEDE